MTDLYAKRLHAARLTRGTSSSVIYEMLLDVAQDVVKPDCALLEFGAGSGELIKLLQARGFSGAITGADILSKPETLGTEIRWVEADLNEPLPLPAASFDAIVSTEVIEHLENPRAVFREFRRLLRPEGSLLLTTPNQESVRSLLSLAVRGHHVAFLDGSYPAHIMPLVRIDLMRLCAETGFEPPQFRYTNHGGLPKLPTVLWQTISAGLLRGRRFSDNLAMISRKAR